MIVLDVRCHMGVYRVPGSVGMGATSETFREPPPSTIFGFLESLIGEGYGSFRGSIAYGRIRQGKQGEVGHLLRTRHFILKEGADSALSLFRVTFDKVETRPRFVIVVSSDTHEGKIRQALRGETPHRDGVLTLGESLNEVYVCKELDAIPETEYGVKPNGTSFSLLRHAAWESSKTGGRTLSIPHMERYDYGLLNDQTVQDFFIQR